MHEYGRNGLAAITFASHVACNSLAPAASHRAKSGVSAFAVAAVAGGAVAAIWAGYPLMIRALALLQPERGQGPSTARALPVCTVVIATRDSPDAIAGRLRDLRQAHYPPRQMDVVVSLDAAVGAQRDAYEAAIGESSARIIADATVPGKAAALNAGVAAARGSVLVFTDTFQRFAPDAIAHLVRSLGEGTYDAVSGLLSLGEGGSSLIRAYWNMEWRLRRDEALLHSAIGVSGSIWALARSSWQPLPTGLILDDLYTPMRIVLDGGRVGFTPAARAFDVRPPRAAGEYDRKVRTLTGNFQLCALLPGLLESRTNPVLLQFLFHKLLRLATPWLLAVGGIALVWGIIGQWGPMALLPLLAVPGGLALLVAALGRGLPLVSTLQWAWQMLAAIVVASTNAARGQWDVWKRA